MADIVNLFKAAGGDFVSSPSLISDRLQDIKAFLFDWDGVFNTGQKGTGMFSGFSEPDSMGINMLRFGYWLHHDKQMPLVALLTGEDNPSAINFAEREHLNSVFSKCSNKINAFQNICIKYELKPNQIAYCFDDILDLSVAGVCGLRFYVRRNIPSFIHYIQKKNLCDYITGNPSDKYAVREVCELILCLLGKYDAALDSRIENGTSYKAYLEQRNKIETEIIHFEKKHERAGA